MNARGIYLVGSVPMADANQVFRVHVRIRGWLPDRDADRHRDVADMA